jgi:hypothetical protein
MGAPIGVMSSKIVLKAGLVLFAARLDSHPALTLIDPSAPVTTIDRTLAERLRAEAEKAQPNVAGSANLGSGTAPVEVDVPRRHVLGLDAIELRVRHVRVMPLDGPAKFVIGRDLLGQMTIRLDFKQQRIRAADLRDSAGLRSGLTAVKLARNPADDCLTLEATDPAGARVTVALLGDSGGGGGAGREVKVGPATLTAYASPAGGRCRAEPLTLTWQSFGKTVVTLDLARDQLLLPGS